jgi:hypothetical protein
MYLCPTVPTPHLDQLAIGDYALALSHQVGDGDNPYTEFFRRRSAAGCHVILNNGAYEALRAGRPLPTLEETLRRAELVGAKEIQFLEVDHDGRGTVEIVQAWIRELDRPIFERYLWHAVVQGKDQRDYTYCFDALADIEAVGVLGLPKVVTPKCFQAACRTNDLAITRLHAVTLLLQRTTKPIHLLGLEDPTEVLLQRKWGDRVRSVDSTYPVLHAMAKVRYQAEVYPFPVDLRRFPFDQALEPEVLELARHNISTLRRWCGEPASAT